MPAPLKWPSKIVLAKLEGTYGTDPTPNGSDDGILTVDVNFTPMEGNDVDRNLEQPYLGAQGTIPTELHAKLNYRVELVGSGTAGNAPKWGHLLRACAMAETITAGTSVVYNPITDNHESITQYFWNDGTLYILKGCRGTAKFMIDAQGIPYIEFEFTGLWVPPSETPRDLPTLTGFQKPEAATNANTPSFSINAVPLVLRSFMLGLGNDVQNRFLIGSEGILITDRSEVIEMTVEAVPLTTLNPFALAQEQATVPVTITHGKTPGKIATIAAPAAQMQRPQSLSGQQGITEWSLRMVPIPVTGNDQFTLTLT